MLLSLFLSVPVCVSVSLLLFHLWNIPTYAQDLFLALFSELTSERLGTIYGMRDLIQVLAVCKARPRPAVLSRHLLSLSFTLSHIYTIQTFELCDLLSQLKTSTRKQGKTWRGYVMEMDHFTGLCFVHIFLLYPLRVSCLVLRSLETVLQQKEGS